MPNITNYQFKTLVDLKPMIDSISKVNTFSGIKRWLSHVIKCSSYETIGMIGFLPTSPTTYEHHAIGMIAEQFDANEHIDELYQHCKSHYSAELVQIDNITTCYLVPLHGTNGVFGCVIIALQEYSTLQNEEWYWSVVGSQLLQAFKRSSSHQRIKITKRERDCILWASEGKTSWEISQILSITERTVNFHLGNCIEKTKSANRQQAIVRYLFDSDFH